MASDGADVGEEGVFEKSVSSRIVRGGEGVLWKPE